MTAREAASLAEETTQGYGDTEDCEEIARIAAFQVQHADSVGGFSLSGAGGRITGVASKY